MKSRRADSAAPWLLLIHQIPPKPDYLRVKIGRRLQRLGAVPVKKSVYVLPGRPQSVEDFQWVRAEIIDGGGDASICKADFVDGLTNEQIVALFRGARDEDYAELAAAARDTLAALRRPRPDAGRRSAGSDDDLVRLTKRLASITAIDFFRAPGRAMAEQSVRTVSDALEPAPPAPRPPLGRAQGRRVRGRTWVTRTGIFVDRIASAWLIRRFIDRDARFKFVDPAAHHAAPRDLRFDMFEGEFTHDGDRCTFETLLSRFAIRDPALRAIAEIVHDIDLKDAKFGRDEAPGIERVLAGIAADNRADEARLERGSLLFDELYAAYTAR
ncbi:MAG TPA: chromate resistance protein ChrB domain-containing protein [Gemmatimonadaceae bacterium]|nr:chromate resistance protein ChrB domain-containing protein [Gemmatimonadaceae bacterium]